jgi:hypothetical protein
MQLTIGVKTIFLKLGYNAFHIPLGVYAAPTALRSPRSASRQALNWREMA